MNKILNKEITRYCRTVKRSLTCPIGLKHAFITDFKSRIFEFVDEQESENIDIQKIKDRFGEPDSIAQSFYATEDIALLQKKAKKYIFYKVVAIILLVALAFASVLLAKMLTKDNNYTITNDFAEVYHEKAFSSLGVRSDSDLYVHGSDICR